MEIAQSRFLFANLFVLVILTVCDGSPLPDSGPGIEIQPAAHSPNGQLDYIVVGNKGDSAASQQPQSYPTRIEQPQNQQANPTSNEQVQYQQTQYQQPQYQQPQYQQPHLQQSQYQQPQYQRPQQLPSYSVPGAPGQYYSSEYQPQYGGLSYLGGSNALSIGQNVIRPAVAAGAALLGGALIFG